jgi:Zn-dependent peptidase ImmA (M78 family)
MPPLSTRRNEYIRKAVEKLLLEADVKSPPVPIEKIARLRLAEIRYVSFEGDMSGLLAREGDGYLIGVNSLHPKTRQRFTIAHELGHLELGHLEQCGEQEILVDRHFKVMLRDEKSSEASDPMEIEANAYAAELLMPTSMLIVERELRSSGIDYEDDALVQSLAIRYKVSRQAMTFRLANLAELLNQARRRSGRAA